MYQNYHTKFLKGIFKQWKPLLNSHDSMINSLAVGGDANNSRDDSMINSLAVGGDANNSRGNANIIGLNEEYN